MLSFLLEAANRARARPAPTITGTVATWLLELVFRPSRRLAVYGSLAPGRENHGRLEGFRGEWRDGVVFGRLERSGWGDDLGYPAMRWDPAADAINVWVLISQDLATAWPFLDAFEGPEYLRSLVPIHREGRMTCVANCYLASPKETDAASIP